VGGGHEANNPNFRKTCDNKPKDGCRMGSLETRLMKSSDRVITFYFECAEFELKEKDT
jgi:hypothetical protein